MTTRPLVLLVKRYLKNGINGNWNMFKDVMTVILNCSWHASSSKKLWQLPKKRSYIIFCRNGMPAIGYSRMLFLFFLIGNPFYQRNKPLNSAISFRFKQSVCSCHLPVYQISINLIELQIHYVYILNVGNTVLWYTFVHTDSKSVMWPQFCGLSLTALDLHWLSYVRSFVQKILLMSLK